MKFLLIDSTAAILSIRLEGYGALWCTVSISITVQPLFVCPAFVEAMAIFAVERVPT